MIFIAMAAGSGTAAAAPPPAGAGETVAGMTREEAVEMARRIAPVVERLRGLKFEREVPVRIVDDEFTRSHLATRLRKFQPLSRLRVEQTAYAQLGLLPPDYDLMKAQLDILEEQAGGYYDPETRTFYILSDMPRVIAPLIMAHELTHALDDQHYDLDSLIRGTMDNEDRALALGSVFEGSGMVVMSAFLMQEVRDGKVSAETLDEMEALEAGRSGQLPGYPEVLRRGLIAPYLLGQAFLLRGNGERVFDGLDAGNISRVFADLPVSSEQILHPEKYWSAEDADRPRDIVLPDMSAALGRGWKLAGGGVLGELFLGVLVEGGGGKSGDASPGTPPGTGANDPLSTSGWIDPASAGWDGDRWQLYSGSGRRVTVLLSVWDTERDAVEFETALPRRDGCSTRRAGAAVALACGDADPVATSRLMDAAVASLPGSD